MKEIKRVCLYLIIVLILSNVCWLIGYSNQEAESSTLFIILASFLPMIVTLIMTKITKEGWNNLGVQFSFKHGWKMYIVSIIGTLFMVYAYQPIMVLLFPNQVKSSFVLSNLSDVGLMTLLGIACFIESMGEELGWISYSYPKLEKIMGSILALLLLGIIRGVYHLGIIFYMEYPIVVFLELTISNVVISPFMIYMYKKSKSIFPCTISHGMANLLPVFINYDNNWYYSNPLPIIVCMIPSVLLGAYGFYGMKKNGLLCRRTEEK